MKKDDLIYYQQRAADELHSAQQAPEIKVARVHSELAKAYLDRIERDRHEPTQSCE